MCNRNIKYVAFYDTRNNKVDNRQFGLAAINKIDYICSALVRNDYEVEIISPSWTNNKSGFYKGTKKRIADNITLKTFSSFGGRSRFVRILKYMFSLIQLFFYLLTSTKKDEIVIVYHSVILSLPIRLAKMLKGFNLILEVEEIYQDAQLLSNFMKKSEYKIFSSADKYIFATEMLNEKINSTKKPSITIYGAYNVEEVQKGKFDDGKTHIVYAGTFDPRKGGAIAAVTSAKFLSSKYHLHIIGFGTDEQKRELISLINEVSEKSNAKVSYDGLLKGKEYISFLQKCDIGLSTQIPNAVYSDSSFPSKILSYMANGLRVVSVRIKVIELSAINDEVYYYDKQEPKSIAEAIMNIDFSQPYDSRKLISKLDDEFTKNINKFLRG